MRYAPDKNNPFPRPRDNVGSTGGNNGGKGGGNKVPMIGFSPGQVQQYVQEQVSGYGGDPKKWADHFRDIYSPVQSAPDYSWERGGRNRGGHKPDKGGNDDGTGTSVDPRPDTENPGHSRMAPMAAMPTQGFLNVPGAGQQISPTLGLLRQPPPGGAQFQLPPEIQAIIARRR